MTDDRKAGTALIMGAIGGLLTMAIHPAGAGTSSLTPEQLQHLSIASGAAHSLGMLSLLLVFLGACGLTRRIAAPDRIAFAAITTYGFACVAALIAMAVSGFIVPTILEHKVRDIAGNANQWQIVTNGIFQINQGFSRIFTVATCLAIGLWSVSAFRTRDLPRATNIYGLVIAALTTIAIAIGHLRLNVHGMALVVLSQAIWFTLVGSRLLSSRQTT